MSDFASAAMLRVLARGMRELGLDPGEAAAEATEARVQLRLKREMLHSAVRQGGLACLPQLGRGLHRLTHEPTHLALVAARDARELFERWQRLERYVHSRHRCVVEHCGARQARIRHLARSGTEPPSAAEDLVVAGVLAALLEAIGLQQVELRLARAAVFPAADPPAIAAAAARGDTAVWHLRWAGTAAPPDERRPDTLAGALRADDAWPGVVRTAYRQLATDLARPWDLDTLAHALGLPRRTLQRRLGEHGTSYSRLLAEARCRAGAWKLLHTADPIAEVGFVCGFADQAHFTREMRRRVGLPPAAYRTAFAPSDSSTASTGAAGAKSSGTGPVAGSSPGG